MKWVHPIITIITQKQPHSVRAIQSSPGRRHRNPSEERTATDLRTQEFNEDQ